MSDDRSAHHEPLRDALRRLPRIRASEGFTGQVMRQAQRPGRRARPTARLWPRLAAVTATLTVLVAAALVTSDHLERRDYERRRAALEQQKDELRRELAEIRERATRPTRLYIDSAPGVDLVVDLDGWMEPTSAVRPASYRTQP